MQGIDKNPHQNRILVIGASPDLLNNNTHLRSYVAEGFRELVGNDFAQDVSFNSAIASIANWQPNLVVLFGSCMPDSAAYLSIKKLCDSNGIPIAFWLHDDPYEFDYSFKAEEIANWIFSNDRWATINLPIHGLFVADTSYYYLEDRGISESIALGKKLFTIIFPKDVSKYLCGYELQTRYLY